MMGRVEPKDLPSTFLINGEKVLYAMVKTYIRESYGEPVSGYMIECQGDDGRTYFAAARVTFEQQSSDKLDWMRSGWDVDFYSTRRSASRALQTGWRRVFKDRYYDDLEEAA